MPFAPIAPKLRIQFRQIRLSSTRSRTDLPPASQAERLVATIRHLSSCYRLSDATIIFSHLRRLSHSSSSLLEHPISSLLSAAAVLRSLSYGSGLHSLSLSIGFFPGNAFTVSRLVAFYAACGLIDYARDVVEDSRAFLALPWNILISLYNRNGNWKAAISSYGTMLARGVRPDNFSNSLVLNACGNVRQLELGKVVHHLILFRNLDCDLFVYNALLAMYAKCGAVDDARRLLDEMPERDIVSWNSVILGYTSEGRWEETSELLEKIRLAGVDLNSVSLNTIMTQLMCSGNQEEALILISQASQKTSFSAMDSVSLMLGLKACSDIGYLKQGKEIHGFVIRGNQFELENITNALIALYSKCCKIRQAYILFQRTSNRTVVTWNTMIAAFALISNNQNAAILLRDMISSRTQPSKATIVTMLALCADSPGLCHGKQLHCYATRHGFEHYLPVMNSIVDMYCKSGRVSLAHKVFGIMATHDKISYTALIAGYALQREGNTVWKLFDEMIRRGIKPDKVMSEVVNLAWRHGRRCSGDCVHETDL